MKRQLHLIGLGFLLFVSTVLHAQPFAIDWFTIAGGGGTSTGGVYSVSGTIGQLEAGVLTGGSYTLTGGFWGVAVAIQEAGAPLLTVTRSGANVILSWSSPSTGFGLQNSSSLGTPNWTGVGSPIDNGTTVTVTLPAPLADRFYRLQKSP